MQNRQIDLVQASFTQVRPIAAMAATLFYERLFTLDPSLRPLFKGDMATQGQMLMSMVASAVGGLRDLDRLVPVLRQLGARHLAYGVKDEHYATVGNALLWTLEQGLGEQFDAETRQAWVAAYGLLADTMQQGAMQQAAAAA